MVYLGGQAGDNYVNGFISAAVAGGVASAITGGKFANGAESAAFAYALSWAGSRIKTGGVSTDGDSVAEPRTMTIEQYEDELRNGGTTSASLTPDEIHNIEQGTSSDEFGTKAKKVFDDAVENKRETDSIRVYRKTDAAGNNTLTVDVVRGVPCGNGSTTCMRLPDPENKGSKCLAFNHFF